MTSGLRSVRDKAVVYFNELVETETYDKLYQAVNAFGQQKGQVAEEDRRTWKSRHANSTWTLLLGGQLKDDEEHKLFMLYPEGNWVELGLGAPL